MQLDDILDVSDAAALLRAESTTVMQFARRGELAGTRIGKSWVFLRADVIAFVRTQIARETAERRRQQADGVSAVVHPPTGATGRRRTALPVLPDLDVGPTR